MPKIAQIRILNNEVWVRVGRVGEFPNGLSIMSPEEMEAQKREYSNAYDHGFADAKTLAEERPTKRETAEPDKATLVTQACIESIIRRHATGWIMDKEQPMADYLFAKAEEMAKDILAVYPASMTKRESGIDWEKEARHWEAEAARLMGVINTPELIDFIKAVPIEAAHQQEKWGNEHDGGKTPQDWFWLIGYLAGKALHKFSSGDMDKALHHTITTAAACYNWHAAMLGNTNMRPGIEPPDDQGRRGTDNA